MKKKLRKKNECAIELRLHNLSLGLSQRNWLFNNRNDWMENKSINSKMGMKNKLFLLPECSRCKDRNMQLLYIIKKYAIPNSVMYKVCENKWNK